jgi:1-acyl-sn-glycerol-3-phosphate acyltransferase
MEQGGHQELLARTDAAGVNRVLLRVVRLLFVPFFRLYFRLGRIGREHVPRTGPVIFAANHRSFLDPFVIATLTPRPIYFVAKKELFEKSRIQRWFLNGLGAFPIDRGSGDDAAMGVARRILERGDCVMIFPEGTRVRPGPLGRPRRGVGRLALETGAAVVPVAVHGTDDVRRGWRIYPRRVTVRAGAALTFPQVDRPSAALAKAVTDRVWPCVELQWEWLGGTAPVRHVAIVGAGSWGTSLAVALGRSGVEVELGCRSAEQAELVQRKRVNERYLPGVALPEAVHVMPAADLELAAADVVCLAVPTRAIPAATAQIADRLGAKTALLVLSKGLVGPAGDLPATYCAARAGGRPVACLGGPAHAADALEHGAALVVACSDREQTARLRALFAEAGFDVETTSDVEGVDLAGVAKNAAVLAAATASVLGPNAAGAAAGKVFAEVAAYAGAIGGRPETWTGLAGAGDLVASVVASNGRNRRAGELLARGVQAAEVGAAIGQVAESLDTLPLLVKALEQRGVRAPATRALADVVEGRGSALHFAEQVTAPRRIVGTRVA